MTASELTFLDRRQTTVDPGDYSVKVEQLVEVGDPTVTETFCAEHSFSVLGPRFTLDPQEIQEMFPAPGSLGDHANVLPHIILKRSTLPWERHAKKGDRSRPWLALLLFDEKELPEERQSTKTLKDLRSKYQFFKDDLPPEKGDHDDDQVTVIEVPGNVLKQLQPTEDDLLYLAHVRQTAALGDLVAIDQSTPAEQLSNPAKTEVAVLIGNRLPVPGGTSIVHLVSLENRYPLDASVYGKADLVPLVSLKSWRFSCISTKHTFKSLLTHLNHQLLFSFATGTVTDPLVRELKKQEIPQAIRAAFVQSGRPLSNATTKVNEYSRWRISDAGKGYYLVSNKLNVFNQAGRKAFDAPLSGEDVLEACKKAHPELKVKAKSDDRDHWWIDDGSNRYFISVTGPTQKNAILYVYSLDPDSSSTLRLPPLPETDSASPIETYFKRGCVPLPHATHQGDETVSWYHGPLAPGENRTARDVDLPIRSADKLLLYNKDDGMCDVSYAAAWELGRLLTLQKTLVAAELFNWKRAHAHDDQLLKAEDRLVHLPYDKVKTDLSMPASVAQWFGALARLEGVPFSYLVPDERMLPVESIRFFWVDWLWIECLLDGAFSVGRVMTIDHRQDQTHAANHARTLVQNRDVAGKPLAVTGCLLRSDVVSGWPGLLVNGYDGDRPVDPLRPTERLSKNVLLCLFAGRVTAVDVRQRPETLHFGFNRPDSSVPDSYYKEKTTKEKTTKQVPVEVNGHRVVDISKLAKDLVTEPEGLSAKFASAMIEAGEGVRLLVRAPLIAG